MCAKPWRRYIAVGCAVCMNTAECSRSNAGVLTADIAIHRLLLLITLLYAAAAAGLCLRKNLGAGERAAKRRVLR